MNASDSFKVAGKAEKFAACVFLGMIAASGALLVIPWQGLELIISPFLIVGSLSAIVAGAVVTIYQNKGNSLQRASQLTDALGVPLGDQVRVDYYNNTLPPSIARLATTTFENTLFTKEILIRMLHRERLVVAIYIALFILLMGFRGASLGWLVFFAQTLFSADVIMNWWRMERFHYCTNQTHQKLHQFFIQDGNAEKLNGVALILATFTDYECAKDEAGMPLDGEIFEKLNPSVSVQWEEIKRTLKIG